jgi:uncharacterized membrane protein YjjB (DUF3815 family)
VQATWQEVGVSAVTGVLVGLLVVAGIGRRRPSLASPFLASLGVSVLVLELFEHGRFDGGPIQLIVPALFFFIPGDAISAAALELADNRITAGASRLVCSLVTLLVLAFGALVATVVAGVPPSALFDVTVAGNLGPVAVWGGWVLVAAGPPPTCERRTPPGREVGSWAGLCRVGRRVNGPDRGRRFGVGERPRPTAATGPVGQRRRRTRGRMVRWISRVSAPARARPARLSRSWPVELAAW